MTRLSEKSIIVQLVNETETEVAFVLEVKNVENVPEQKRPP
jgi:hypothetical protein